MQRGFRHSLDRQGALVAVCQRIADPSTSNGSASGVAKLVMQATRFMRSVRAVHVVADFTGVANVLLVGLPAWTAGRPVVRCLGRPRPRPVGLSLAAPRPSRPRRSLRQAAATLPSAATVEFIRIDRDFYLRGNDVWVAQLGSWATGYAGRWVLWTAPPEGSCSTCQLGFLERPTELTPDWSQPFTESTARRGDPLTLA